MLGIFVDVWGSVGPCASSHQFKRTRAHPLIPRPVEQEGNYADARVAFEKGIRVLEHALGSAHTRVGEQMLLLGDVYRKQAEWVRALDTYTRVHQVIDSICRL